MNTINRLKEQFNTGVKELEEQNEALGVKLTEAEKQVRELELELDEMHKTLLAMKEED